MEDVGSYVVAQSWPHILKLFLALSLVLESRPSGGVWGMLPAPAAAKA